MADLPRRDWLDMTWTDFTGADTSRWVAVLPVAAVEQHGPHLPLGVDTFIADSYLERVRANLPEAMPVTFLPRQAIGASEEHIGFPGTLSYSAETMIRVLTETAAGVHRAGLRKLVVVNSHGGNVPMIDIAARNLRAELGMLVVIAAWHRFGYPDGLFSQEERVLGIHGGDVETSLVLAARPNAVREREFRPFPSASLPMKTEFTWLNSDRPAGFGWATQDLNPEGALGNPTLSSREKGEMALAHGARAFIELLADVDRFDLARLKPGPLG